MWGKRKEWYCRWRGRWWRAGKQAKTVGWCQAWWRGRQRWTQGEQCDFLSKMVLKICLSRVISISTWQTQPCLGIDCSGWWRRWLAEKRFQIFPCFRPKQRSVKASNTQSAKQRSSRWFKILIWILCLQSSEACVYLHVKYWQTYMWENLYRFLTFAFPGFPVLCQKSKRRSLLSSKSLRNKVCGFSWENWKSWKSA